MIIFSLFFYFRILHFFFIIILSSLYFHHVFYISSSRMTSCSYCSVSFLRLFYLLVWLLFSVSFSSFSILLPHVSSIFSGYYTSHLAACYYYFDLLSLFTSLLGYHVVNPKPQCYNFLFFNHFFYTASLFSAFPSLYIFERSLFRYSSSFPRILHLTPLYYSSSPCILSNRVILSFFILFNF